MQSGLFGSLSQTRFKRFLFMFSVIFGPNDHDSSIRSFRYMHYLIELIERFIRHRSIDENGSFWITVLDKVQNVLIVVFSHIWT